MSYPLVRDLAAGGIPVTVTCRVLKIARQPYYRWLADPVTDAELDHLWPADNHGSGMHVLVAEPALAIERGLMGAGMQCSRKTPDHDVARFFAAEPLSKASLAVD